MNTKLFHVLLYNFFLEAKHHFHSFQFCTGENDSKINKENCKVRMKNIHSSGLNFRNNLP